MAKKIQKKQIEDGVFVETKATYSAPTQDNEFVQKKYVDEEVAKKADISHTHSWVDITNKPRISVTLADTAISRTYTIGLTGANGSSGKLIIPKAVSWNDVTDKPTFPTLPSWVTQTKPTYDWTEIQNKPEIDKKVRYERVSDLNILLTEKGILKVADGDNVEGAPVKGSNVWWHFIAGSHLNSLDWQYYLAFPLAIESADFWFKQKLATQDKSWVKFSGLSQLNGNGLFREWNLEHGLSAYIGNSNVFNVRTGVSGGASDLLLEVTSEHARTNKMFDAPIIKIHTPGVDYIALNSKGTKLNVKGDGDSRDGGVFKPVLASGYEIDGKTNNDVVLAGGGTINLSELENKNIQVGGRNLLRKTKEFIVNNEPYCTSYTWSNNAGIITNETFNNNVVRKINGDWQGVKANIPDILGEPVTISFWAKTNGAGNFGNYANKNKNPNHIEDFTKYSNNTTLINDNQWHRYTIYNPKGMCLGEGTTNGFIEFYGVTGDIYYSSIKIEYGNTPTDWSPAPEDLESEIPQYKTITDVHTFLDKDGSIHFGSGSAILNAPSSHFYEMVGFTHSSKQWGFIIAKNIDSNDKRLYVKQVIGGIYKEWFTLEDRSSERTINVTTSTFDITSNVVGQTAHIANDCVLNFNTMPELTTFAVRKVYDGGSVTFSGSLTPIYTGDTVLNGKKGSTAIIDYGLNNQIFIDIRNV